LFSLADEKDPKMAGEEINVAILASNFKSFHVYPYTVAEKKFV
jgi:hypothetical protein